jgi:hypothetical protein
MSIPQIIRKAVADVEAEFRRDPLCDCVDAIDQAVTVFGAVAEMLETSDGAYREQLKAALESLDTSTLRAAERV